MVDGTPFQHPEGAELQLDVSAARWIRDRVLPWGADVGTRVCALVPTGYEAYVRVIHPDEGTLDRHSAERLVAVLRGRTSTPASCWLAIWHGYGELSGGVRILVRQRRFSWLPLRRLLSWFGRHRTRTYSPEPPEGLTNAETFSLPGREYYLYRGAIDVGPRFEFWPGHLQTPNMWWPDDRSWFVATEIDLDSTLVGCDRACADALLASDLESIEVGPEARLDVEGDDLDRRS